MAPRCDVTIICAGSYGIGGHRGAALGGSRGDDVRTTDVVLARADAGGHGDSLALPVTSFTGTGERPDPRRLPVAMIGALTGALVAGWALQGSVDQRFSLYRAVFLTTCMMGLAEAARRIKRGNATKRLAARFLVSQPGPHPPARCSPPPESASGSERSHAVPQVPLQSRSSSGTFSGVGLGGVLLSPGPDPSLRSLRQTPVCTPVGQSSTHRTLHESFSHRAAR